MLAGCSLPAYLNQYFENRFSGLLTPVMQYANKISIRKYANGTILQIKSKLRWTDKNASPIHWHIENNSINLKTSIHEYNGDFVSFSFSWF